jgi:hypothetical protein
VLVDSRGGIHREHVGGGIPDQTGIAAADLGPIPPATQNVLENAARGGIQREHGAGSIADQIGSAAAGEKKGTHLIFLIL